MGRGITAQDTPASPRVVVVNEDFVKTFSSLERTPFGTFGPSEATTSGTYEIVGVVGGFLY